MRLVEAEKVWGEHVPLVGSVGFKAVLQKGNRIQVPKLVRWKFKLEQEQVLRVSVATNRVYGWEHFYARMDRSGRITIPKLTLKLLQDKADKKSLTGEVLEVQFDPA